MSVLDVLSSEATGLIRDEIKAETRRLALESGIRQAVRTYGCTVEEVSAVTGFTPTDIYRMLEREDAPAGLDALAGNR